MPPVAQATQTEYSSLDTWISGLLEKELCQPRREDALRDEDAAMPTQTEVQPFFVMRELILDGSDSQTTHKPGRETVNDHLHYPRPFVLRLPRSLRNFSVVLPEQMETLDKTKRS